MAYDAATAGVSMTQGPLVGLRVLDVTHVLNGPFCTMLLAHMGAEVIKVETGAGDRFRHAWAPPGVTRDAYDFLVVSSNKKSIRLNLKTDKGKDLFRQLAKQSDVVTENFTAGVMDRLGLGYEALKAINPRLIYACSRGYGESGPYRDVRANANTITAITGWQAETMRMAQKPGAKLPMEIGDEAAGMSMCVAILAALYSRQHSGKGQKIAVSMQEAFMGFMLSMLHRHFEGVEMGGAPKECLDGYYSFHVPDMTDELWDNLTTALGRPDLIRDKRFLTAEDRRANYPQVESEVAQMVKGKTRQEIWDALRPLGISSAPLLTLAEALEDPHLKARQAFVDVVHPEAGPVKLLAPWMRFSDTPSAITSPAPAVGQHSREVYGSILRLSDQEIDALEREGVIA